jgi:peptidoglycan/xylan/chitin deacetylase (PgdA/CDA1 family)
MIAAIALSLFTLAPGRVLGGGLVLSFDDGYPNWVKVIAPELSRVRGTATGFVNNMAIHNRRISFEDLRLLQDKYGWEIGTHTFHHFDAPGYVQKKGLPTWVKNELDASITELTAQGLKISSLAFPFNSYTPELVKQVTSRLRCFRRVDSVPFCKKAATDKSLPGRQTDLSTYVPLNILYKWIDSAQRRNILLFLYGHRVLPEEKFLMGTVISVSAYTLVAKAPILIDTNEQFCLVPDTSKMLSKNLPVVAIQGKEVKIGQGDLGRLCRPGATFVIGPCYGMRVSDFRKLVEYASKRLTFYTFSQVAKGIP